jgi:hypothetical protein
VCAERAHEREKKEVAAAAGAHEREKKEVAAAAEGEARHSIVILMAASRVLGQRNMRRMLQFVIGGAECDGFSWEEIHAAHWQFVQRGSGLVKPDGVNMMGSERTSSSALPTSMNRMMISARWREQSDIIIETVMKRITMKVGRCR